MSVLFVCLGNICRSPTAEAVFRRACPETPCDSAGTASWHVGKPPYGPMQQALLAQGQDMSDLRARQFKAADFEAFDVIVGMDPENVEDIEALRPHGNDTPVVLLAPFSDTDLDTVPDPYYTRDFEGALSLIEMAVAGLITNLDDQGALRVSN